IWLKLPQAKNKTYFRAQSSAGFKAQDLINWQSQIAAQLLIQNAPSDWQSEQLDDWKKQHKVNLFLNQNATTLTFDGSTENENLAQLLRLYYAYQLETNIKQGLDDSKESLLRTINLQHEKNDDRERLKALSKLRYGVESIDYLPTQDELNDLSEQELDQQWRKMSVAPTTFFIVNDMDAEDVKKTVRRYLAAIPRTKTLDSTHILPTTGKDSVRFPMNLEPKDDVRIWFFTPHQWQGKDALSVSILRNIVANKLKLSLRDEHLGIYSLRFDSTLNPETQRIESELSFASNPAMTEKLIQQAHLVLQALPQQISEEDVKQAKNQFIQAEKQRLEQPDVWLNRLVLSENHFADPRYLSDMRSLHDGITLENIRGMAANIYHAENQKVFITTPKENVQ
ncbi:MAG TPA: peptidase M16, partial [Pasteurellaceae bacterium]|nr:peptidase M16 [Pasteurellaceae bacterium]